MSSMRRLTLAALFTFAGLFLLTCPSPADCCPFCSGTDGKTLTADAADASLILYGKLVNARLDPKDQNAGQTDLEIETVVKTHAILAGRKVITIPRYMPAGPDDRVLIFFDVYKGQLDSYRGEPVKADSCIAAYVKGALAVKEKDAGTRLKFYFDYLEDKDQTVSLDAYKEFASADYKDYRLVAEKLPPETLARWLKDPNTSIARLGLYASMLGHCGKPEHAKLLRDLLDDPQRQGTSGMDGIMAGYVLIRPAEGWAALVAIMRNEKLDFNLRYAALRASRFFHDYRPDLIAKADMAGAVSVLIEQKDIADLAIEDLRKWGCWDAADKVLDVYNRESHSASIIRRAILRYALNCPPTANPRVAPFLAERRKDSAKLLEEVQELLNLEAPKPATSAAASPPVAATPPGK
jgi:hypothetical protein